VITLALFLGMVALVAIDVPIALALGIVALGASWWAKGADSMLSAAVTLFTGATSFPLLAIPLFVLAGAIMNTSGISRRLVAFASALVGFVRGGLAMVNILTSMFFAEISGSAVADVAALGTVIMPAMQRRGYPKPFTAAVTSSAASLAVIIPPSIPMILYAVMADTSVVKLFVAGIVPGILGGVLMMALAYGFAVRRGYPVEEAFHLRRVWTTFKESFWAFLLPVIILGGIFGGLVTATEGAALAVAVALLVGGVAYRELSVVDVWHALKDGAVQTAVVMLLIATSALLGQYLTEQRIPQLLSQSIMALTHNTWVVLALFNLFFFVLGFFLHGAAAIILVVPIVMPIVNALGIDPIHFGLIVTLNIAIGQQTPPVASVLVTCCSIAKADIWEVSRVNVWFVAVLIFVLLLVTYVPLVSLGLVHLFYG
jgi:tripartite ATP-independent transporter DctM subunit